MKIFLKETWDYPSSYDPEDKRAIFVGRTREKEKIKDEFLRKESGSILISGVRGVGKTSLVYQALRECVDKNSRIVPVVISASQLELYTEDFEGVDNLPKTLLENLIRRLYGYFRTSNVLTTKSQVALADLYRKTRGSFSKTDSVSTNESESSEETNTSTRKWELAVDQDYLFRVAPFLLGVITLFSPPIHTNYPQLNLILGVVLFFVPNFTYTQLKERVKSFAQRSNTIQEAKLVYQEDNSLGNLEAEFNDVLRLLRDEEMKVIFVIDELDKIEKKDGSGDAAVFQLIKTYKNLFTLSSALFVFITDDKAHDKLVSARKTRSAPYTLFTNRIFINRPSFADIEAFIDSAIEKIVLEDGTEITADFRQALQDKSLKAYRNFKNYLCYHARGDYFDIGFSLRDFISHYEEVVASGKYLPVIVLGDFDEFDQILQSKLQKVLGQVFERTSYTTQSEWYRNDKIANTLYDFLEKNYYTKFEFDLTSRGETDYLVNDYLIPYLERSRIIARKGTRAENHPDGTKITYTEFIWTGSLPGEDGIEDIPSSPTTRFRGEETFLSLGQRYVEQINHLDDVRYIVLDKMQRESYKVSDGIADNMDGRQLTGINAQNIYSKYEDAIDTLSAEPPGYVEREVLANLTKELREEIKKLRDVAWSALINLVRHLFSEKSAVFAEASVHNSPDLLNELPTLRDHLAQNSVQHTILTADINGRKKTLVLTENLDPQVLTEEVLRKLTGTSQYKLINLQTKEDLDYQGKYEVATRKQIINLSGKSLKSVSKASLRKVKVSNFRNYKLEEDYTILATASKDALTWFY